MTRPGGGVAQEHPPLLMAPGLGASIGAALRLLRGWSPRSDPEAILELNPALILRLPKYYEGKEFFQLPIDVQNVMAVGGGASPCALPAPRSTAADAGRRHVTPPGGGGTHYRSWSGEFEDNNTD